VSAWVVLLFESWRARSVLPGLLVKHMDGRKEGKGDNMSVPELKTLDYDELADEAISVCIRRDRFTAITAWDLERKSDATGYLLKIARVLKKKHGKDKPIPQWFNDIISNAGGTCLHYP